MNILEKISNKIEEVRREPEHVRLRWVWGSVVVSMLFIIAIWIFSMTLLFQGDKSDASEQTGATQNITEQLQDLQQQAPSIKNISDQASNLGAEGVAKTQSEDTPRQ